MVVVLNADRLRTSLCIVERNGRLLSNCFFPLDGLNEEVRYLGKSGETNLPHGVEIYDHVGSSGMTNYRKLLEVAKRHENEMTSIDWATIEMSSW